MFKTARDKPTAIPSPTQVSSLVPNVTWSYGNTGLKEEITMSNATKTVLQNHPPSQYGLNDTSRIWYSSLNLTTRTSTSTTVQDYLDGNVTISDAGVDFKDILGQFKCTLPLGEAYELNNESVRQKLTYRIVHLNGNTYLLSGLKGLRFEYDDIPSGDRSDAHGVFSFQ